MSENDEKLCRCVSAGERHRQEAISKVLGSSTDADPSAWARVTLMVYATGEMHAIGGDREPGEGDRPYIGLERIKRSVGDDEASLDWRTFLREQCEKFGTPIEEQSREIADIAIAVGMEIDGMLGELQAYKIIDAAGRIDRS